MNRQIPHDTAHKRFRLWGDVLPPFQADLSRQDEIEPLVDRVVSAMGRVDILVNNAGTAAAPMRFSFSEKDWDDVLNLNLKSVFFLSQAVT